MREKVADLRRRFSLLLDENASMPVAERLPRDAFHIDPGLKESIEAETEAHSEKEMKKQAAQLRAQVGELRIRLRERPLVDRPGERIHDALRLALFHPERALHRLAPDLCSQ